MKNSNLKKNQLENNPMFGKHHSDKSKQQISESQLKRNKNLNQLLFKLREDQLNERIERICHNLLEQKLTVQNESING